MIPTAAMAILRHVLSEQTHRLMSMCLVGRGTTCTLQLKNGMASSEHASIRWTGTDWKVHDLNSKNGTFVDDRKLQAGERATLQIGARIAFGDVDDVYEVNDISAPRARAIRDDGDERFDEDGLLVLPDLVSPQVTISAVQSAWIAEWNDGAQRAIKNGHWLAIDGRSWRIHLPIVPTMTVASEATDWSLQRMTLRFLVSLDEETVSLELRQDGDLIELRALSHNYLLLTLARKRIEDQQIQPPLPESEHGWMSTPELIDGLRMNETQFNVSILRARRMFSRAGIPGFTALIERRTRARQIRIGVPRLEVKQ